MQNGAALLETDCDTLIPATLAGVTNVNNAVNVKAPLIIDAANGPVTATADTMLHKKGCIIFLDM